MRFLVATAMGIVTALALFLLMHSLISGAGQRDRETSDGRLVEFIRVTPDEATRVKERRKPARPPPPRRPPPPPKMTVTRQSRPPPQQLDIRTPNIQVSPSTGSGPYLGAFDPGDPAAEGDVIPIVRIQPQYPREALIEGTEGWVDIEFTINEDGTVADPTVIEAQPNRVFNRAALRAIMRWKFKPRVIDGVAVKRRASQRIEFQLDNAG